MYVLQNSKRTDFWKYFDLVMPSVALAQGFGRIGCFLAGCCYGRETNSIFSVTFQNSDFAPNHVALIPTQIYSSVLDFLHFWHPSLYCTDIKKKNGQVAACYLIFYSIGQICAGIFPRRSDSRKCRNSFYFAVYQSCLSWWQPELLILVYVPDQKRK